MTKKTITLLAFILASALALSGCSAASEIKNAIQDVMDPGYATDRAMSFNVNMEGESALLDGLYTGPLKDGKADGDGVFTVDYVDGSKLTYKGSFINGRISGEGVLTVTENDGVEFKYSGNFRAGALDGYGTASVTAEGETYSRKGTFSYGVFKPTTGEKYDYLGQLDLFGKFSLPENVIEYIDSHPEYFPSAGKSGAESASLQNFEYKRFNKTRKQEEIGLVKLELGALQVFEDPIEDISETVTHLLAVDEDSNYYALYYLGSAEVFEKDVFTVYALPVAAASFENVSGGVTNVIVLLGSYLETTDHVD